MFFAHSIVLTCVVIWGWTFVASKLCLAYLTPVDLLGARFLIGFPILIGLVLFRRTPIRVAGTELRAIGLGSLFVLTHFLLQAFALNRTSATNTGWLITVTPLAIAGLSAIFLGEKIRKNQFIGIGLATLGILLLVSKGKFRGLGWLGSVGDWMILVSSFTWALYTIVSRDLSRARDPLCVALLMYFPLATLTVCHLVFVSNVSVLTILPGQAWIALLFLGVLGTLSQWFWQIGVAKLGATKAGVFLYLEPVATTVLAVPLLHEEFGLFTALGGLLVIAGVWQAQSNFAGIWLRRVTPRGAPHPRNYHAAGWEDPRRQDPPKSNVA